MKDNTAELRRNNILFVSPHRFNPYAGGIERVSCILMSEFKQKEYNVFCLHHYTEEEKCSDKENVFFLPDKNLFTDRNRQYYKNILESFHINIIIDQRGISNFDTTTKFYFNPDVNKEILKISVLHSSPLLFLNCYPLFYKSVLKSTNQLWKKFFRLLYYPISYYRYYLSRKEQLINIQATADKIVLLSKNHISEFNKLIGITQNDKLVSIPNPNTYGKEDIFYPKKKKILYIGRLEDEKNVQILLEIWDKLYPKYPDWEFIIVGNGNKKEELEKFSINRKQKRVFFEGRQDPTNYYRETSIILLSSFFEGFPMVLTEAMRFGCVPVIFNTFSAASDIIMKGYDGFLIPPYNKKEFVEKIELLLNDSIMLQKFSQKASISVSKFDKSEVVKDWAKLFELYH